MKHIYDAAFIYTPAAKQEADYLKEKFRKIRESNEAEKKRAEQVAKEAEAVVAKTRIKGKTS